MEGTMSEIRMFAGNFAPKYWAFCQGQTIAINTNQALFALLGTMYGGNGTTNFMLPNFAGEQLWEPEPERELKYFN
uniref:Phage tail protein n=1 Tax=Chryseobacterium endophyticum TaxID=1854762 RepID=A0AAU6WMQ9_9FLAO